MARNIEYDTAKIIDRNKNLSEDLGLDSIDIIEIVMTVEGHFNIEIADEVAEKIKTVEDLINAVEGELKNAGCR